VAVETTRSSGLSDDGDDEAELQQGRLKFAQGKRRDDAHPVCIIHGDRPIRTETVSQIHRCRESGRRDAREGLALGRAEVHRRAALVLPHPADGGARDDADDGLRRLAIESPLQLLVGEWVGGRIPRLTAGWTEACLGSAVGRTELVIQTVHEEALQGEHTDRADHDRDDGQESDDGEDETPAQRPPGSGQPNRRNRHPAALIM
jgi:hypothetical protein